MDKELLLYRYFSGELTPTEQAQFEELLVKDADFAEQYEFEKDLKQVVVAHKKESMKATLKGFEKDRTEVPVRKLPRNNYLKWSMAASFALLIALGWLGYESAFGGIDYEDLYQENFENYPNTAYTITRSDASESLERKAFIAYEIGNYQEALAGFEGLPKAERPSYIDFYTGLCHLNLGNSLDAIHYLERGLEKESEYQGETYWYLALASIQQENKEQALGYLQKLIASYDYKKGKAQKLIEQLK